MKTMNEVFDKYIKECIPRLGARTQRDYVRHVENLRIHFGHRAPDEVRPRDVGRFLDVDTGKQHRNKQVAVLSAVFGKCVGKWYVDGVDSNPCLRVERHESHPRTRYITDSEFAAVRALAPETVQIMMDLALLTGQRQGDLLDLTWGQVHHDHVRFVQSKTKKALAIRLSDALAEVLLRARRYHQFRGPQFYVIRTRTGDPYTHEGARALWQRVAGEAMRLGAIKTKFTFHDIRAKCASDKDDLKSASELLGHGDTKLTDRVYVRSMKFVEPLR